MYTGLAKAAVAAFRSKNKAAARELIADPECPAPALCAAAHTLLDPEWEYWLWETVVHELAREGMYDYHADLIGMIQATACTGAPWREYRAFAMAANTFAHMPTETHAFVPPEPHHMAALIPEMSLIFALESADEKELPEYSDEVEAYVAAALAHHGFCCAPDELSFCQDRLDKLVTGHTCERSKKLDASKEAESKDSTPSENIQTHRYEETCEYVKERLARNLKALQRLA